MTVDFTDVPRVPTPEMVAETTRIHDELRHEVWRRQRSVSAPRSPSTHVRHTPRPRARQRRRQRRFQRSADTDDSADSAAGAA